MSYKKFLKKVTLPKARMGVSNLHGNEENNNVYDRYKNYLPIIYQGPSNRGERYTIYDNMVQDPIINWSIQTIADFIIQSDKDKPFIINYDTKEKLPDSQTLSIEKGLEDWIQDNEWKRRIFPTVVDILKYGDVFFIRDPETYELNKVNIYDVLGVVVDDLKNPTHYLIKNVDLNIPAKIATSSESDIATKNIMNTINTNFANVSNANGMTSSSQYLNQSSGQIDDNSKIPVEAKHIIHLSLNVDDILLYPFGCSILENIYKVYIQKMLLQDCVLLMRMKNAPDKMVYKIPVGHIPMYKRQQYMESIRNNMSQRRMPTKDSDGVFNTIDVAYNSIPMSEDYFLPVDADGVQPDVSKINGTNNLGEITDLNYWQDLLIRGLNVPQSWVPYGPQDGQRAMPTNIANTYVQELRFFKYCCRMQDIIIPELDKEFKIYLNHRGINIDNDSFTLEFNAPTNITEIAEEEMNTNRLNVFSTASQNPYISKQFALKKYLKLTEEEYNENQRLLIMENQDKLKDKKIDLPVVDKNVAPGLRSVDISNIPQDYMAQAQEQMMNGMGMPSGDMGMAGGDMGGMPMDANAGNGMGAAPMSDGMGAAPANGQM